MKNKVFIGCSGFSSRDWKGFFYPENLPAKEQLTFYSENFNSVEINSTFYRRPRQQTLQNWYDLSSGEFRFFIKTPKTITHFKKLTDTHSDTADFCQYIKTGLKEKLAGFLFQFPPSFHFSEENLEKVLTTVDDHFLNVVEFRHASWWNDVVLKRLEEKNILFSGVSFPGDMPDDFIINNKEHVYYRLHGVPVLFKSEYSEPEMEKLAENIKNSNRKVFVYFNNTWGIAALKNSFFLKKILE